MRTLVVSAIATLCTLAAASASAQTCAARPSFAGAPWQARVESGFSSDARTFGPSIVRGWGSFFAGAAADLTGYAGLEATAVSTSVTVGAERALGARVYVCPVLTVLHQFGPDFTDAELSANATSLGGRLGIVAATYQTLQIVPMIGMDAQWERDRVDVEGRTSHLSRTFTVSRLAVGLVMNQRVAIVPEIIEIFGTAGNSTFRVTAAFGF
jgi:hypothetical protein